MRPGSWSWSRARDGFLVTLVLLVGFAVLMVPAGFMLYVAGLLLWMAVNDFWARLILFGVLGICCLGSLFWGFQQD